MHGMRQRAKLCDRRTVEVTGNPHSVPIASPIESWHGRRRQSDPDVFEWFANGFPRRQRWILGALIALAVIEFLVGDLLIQLAKPCPPARNPAWRSGRPWWWSQRSCIRLASSPWKTRKVPLMI